jgi:DNA-3-methyladenine glycosylase
MAKKINKDFFCRDIFIVADELIGKLIVRRFSDGSVSRYRITEIEMYVGENDLACHASKGRTTRTEIMFGEGGHVYIYLIYGMYWLFNIVTGCKDQAQAILIRGVQNIDGPGRVGRALNLDKSFYGEDLSVSERIWIEDDQIKVEYSRHPRINIDYSGEIWKNKAYRYVIK